MVAFLMTSLTDWLPYMREETVNWSFSRPGIWEYVTKQKDSLCGYSYGCLMRKSISPQMAYHMTFQGEYGWDGWLGTFFENLPTHGITMLMGMQLSDPEGNFISEKIRNLIHPML